MSTAEELFTIGQLARRTGVPARTIRFWSDAGLIPPAARSASGYRLYDAEAVARLELISTLRQLGLGLEVVTAVLSRTRTLAEVAAAHVTALDTEIRTLRLRRAVLSTVASRGAAMEEAHLMHKLATLSARERQRIIDDFVAEVFQGVDPGSPAMGIARGMRQMPAELPDDPAPEQVDAWIELGELVADESFRQRARAMAVAGAQGGVQGGVQGGAQGGVQGGWLSGGEAAGQPGHQLIAEHAGRAAAEGIDPGSAEGKAVLDRIVPPDTPPAERERLLAALETFTDARVERYWQLLAVVNGRPAPPSVVPAFEWLIAALRADAAPAAR